MKGKIALLLAMVAAYLLNRFAVPMGLDSYVIFVLNVVAINVLLAVAFNLVMGYAGQFSLGHAGFMAIGAYSASAFTIFFTRGTLHIPGVISWQAQGMFLCAMLVGGLAAALAGFLVGVPSLRLKGDYLAIVTLGFGEIIRVIFQNMEAVGGPRGLSGIPKQTDLFWSFSMAFIAIYVVTALVRSVYGSGFLVTRDDEVAAEAMGVNTTKYKVIAFVLSAFFTGIGGALYAHLVRTITPDGFNFQKSVEILVMVIFGGLGNVIGVIFAAIFLGALNELLRDVSQWRMVIYSLLLIVIMILRPGGLLGTPTEIRRLFYKLGFRPPKPAPNSALAAAEAPAPEKPADPTSFVSKRRPPK